MRTAAGAGVDVQFGVDGRRMVRCRAGQLMYIFVIVLSRNGLRPRKYDAPKMPERELSTAVGPTHDYCITTLLPFFSLFYFGLKWVDLALCLKDSMPLALR